MISNLGKYIPFIFLVIAIFIFLDALTSFTVIHHIQEDQNLITQTYQHIRLSPHQRVILAGNNRAAFAISIEHMYAIILLSAIFNLFLLIFVYVIIMRELRRRTLLEQKKNDFISLASHELKTPITSMSIFNQLLAQKIPKKNRQAVYLLQKMDTQIKEMINLVNDLLDVTRIQLGKLDLHKERINLSQFIRETVEDIQPTTKKHTITFRGPSSVEVFVDKQRLWQVLANLLTNAIKYSPKGGRISIRLDKKITRAVVSIRDWGIGINKANKAHIFERYFREESIVRRSTSGLGLGLFLAKQILELHNGRIWVKSDVEKGATFSFTLPLAKERKKE